MVLKLLAGVLCGIACMFIGGIVEKILLGRRKLELLRVRFENYFIIAGMAAFGSLIMWRIPLSAEIIYAFILLIICEIVVIIDSHHRIIPNGLLMAIFILKVGFDILYLFGVKGFSVLHIVDSVVGLIVGLVVFMLPAVLTKKVGAGDIKLSAIVGFTLGLIGWMVAIVCMGVLVIIYIILQRKLSIATVIKTMIPMGPFLATAMMIVMLLPKGIFLW